MARSARVSAKTLAKVEEPKLWNEYKRQSIQAAVIRLMCREGVDAVTMERVAQEVGIAKGTVYLHYHDKQELLEAVKESALEPLTAKTEEVLKGGSDGGRKLRMYALRYLTYFDENRDLFRVLLYEREVTRVVASRYRTPRYRRMLDSMTNVIADGVRDGIFREVDPRKAAAMFIESNIALVNQRLLADVNTPVEDDAQLVADVFLRGMTSDSGRSGRRSVALKGRK